MYALILSSNFNLFPDCDDKCTVGVQFPETQIQSHVISSKFAYPVLSSFNFPIVADFTFKCPFVFTTPYENLILIPKFFASFTIELFELFLTSTIKGLMPFF